MVLFDKAGLDSLLPDPSEDQEEGTGKNGFHIVPVCCPESSLRICYVSDSTLRIYCDSCGVGVCVIDLADDLAEPEAFTTPKIPDVH